MIQLQDLSKAFGEKLIFDRLSYQFPLGEKIALVGANGAGKTTLLNMICGIEQADAGSIVKPQDFNLAYLPQEPNANPQASVVSECQSGNKKLYEWKIKLEEITRQLAVNTSEKLQHEYSEIEANYRMHGGYELEAKAHSILDGLGFNEAMRQKNPLELSGGWRMRLELAKIFLNPIDFLVLDEPTNHLDLPALVWFEQYLKKFNATLLFVSHDRGLLNRLSTLTLHLKDKNLKVYKGNFDKFLELKNIEQEQNLARLENLGKKKDSLQEFVDRFGAKATKAKQAQSKLKLIEKLRALEDDVEIEQETKSIGIELKPPVKSARIVAEIQKLSIGYSECLFKGLDLQIERGQKIAIIGANGIGKSTTLKTIAGKLKPLEGKLSLGNKVELAYYSQNPEENLNLEQPILTEILSSSSQIGENYARSLLGAFLFHDKDVFKPIRVLSGGEKSRVALAKMLVKEANFLLLDEPTNHLDMSSVEALSSALLDYEGSLVFVSHDRDFIDAICTHILVMLADGRFMLFHGKLADYERQAKLIGFPNLLSLEESSPIKNEIDSSNADKHKEAKVLKSKRQSFVKLISKLESQQTKLQASCSELEHEMADYADSNEYEKLQITQTRYEQKKTELEQIENDWLEASDELEKIEEKLAQMGRLS